MGTRPWIEHRSSGLALGLVITLLGALALSLGWLNPLDHFGLDLHVRCALQIEADDRIALIDIDDTSLEVISEWPWPRRRMAQLVRSLSQAGAAAIVLDSVYTDPTSPRAEHAGYGPDYDLETELPERGDRQQDAIVFHDAELRDAINEAGNVYLGMFGKLAPVGTSGQARTAPGPGGVGNDSARMPEALTNGIQSPDEDLHAFCQLALDTLRAAFSADFEVAWDKVPPKLAPRVEELERIWGAAKRHVAQSACARFLEAHPSGSWPEFYAYVLPNGDRGRFDSDRHVLIDAYRWARAMRQVSTFHLPSGRGQRTLFPRVYDQRFPLPMLAEAAHGVGLVAYGREAGDGVLRSLPLLVRGPSGHYANLGFLVACDTLGVHLNEIRLDRGQFELLGDDAPRIVPVEANGETLIAWHSSGTDRRWWSSFLHRPAHRTLRAAMLVDAVEENERRIGVMTGALVAERHRQTPAAYADYEQRVNAWWVQRRSQFRSMHMDAIGASASDGERRDSEIAAIERDALVWVQRNWALWRDAKPRTDAERLERETVARLHREFVDPNVVQELRDLNRQLVREAAASFAELRADVAGRICLVGNTASSVADLVTTPVDVSMPGVMAHANIINMMLQDCFVRTAPGWLQTSLLVGLGLLTTYVTNRGRPFSSLLAAVLSAGALTLIGVVSFRQGHTYLATLPMVASAAFVWVGVTVHRQFTEERTRRSYQRALSQYTSPQIAGRIAQDPELRLMASQSARVTCFFCDLHGFTALSERLGPRATRDVLNPYLEQMSTILVDHGAIVNKFIGDGIFAFFNAPICPCEDHAVAASKAALACHTALSVLAVRDEEGGEHLRMRIGLATGEVFVGNYGSDSKLDYTCIGDRVNLAARLEKANKALGTSILIDKPTRDSVGSSWAVRAVGKLRVPGRTEPVEAFELLGDVAGDAEAHRAHATCLEQAIRSFQDCEWGQARELFAECERLRPGDQVAQLYLSAIAQHERFAPSDDWCGAVTLRLD